MCRREGGASEKLHPTRNQDIWAAANEIIKKEKFEIVLKLSRKSRGLSCLYDNCPIILHGIISHEKWQNVTVQKYFKYQENTHPDRCFPPFTI